MSPRWLIPAIGAAALLGSGLFAPGHAQLTIDPSSPFPRMVEPRFRGQGCGQDDTLDIRGRRPPRASACETPKGTCPLPGPMPAGAACQCQIREAAVSGCAK